MDEQTNPAPEPTTTTPDPVVADTIASEPQQAEAVQPLTEVPPTPETPINTDTATEKEAQTITPPEPIAEPPTAQLVGNEPLPEPVPPLETPTLTQGSISQPEPTPTPVSMPAQAPATPAPPRNLARLFLEKAQVVIQLRKQKKLTKIMALFLKKKHITNDEVEKLLHVSDATATRYLAELEKRGLITQTGKTGHAVSYSKR